MTKLILSAALVAAVLAGPVTADARPPRVGLVLTYEDAVAIVRASGGAVKSCKRVTPRRFRCRAVYWSIRHEAEEVEPGVWVEIATEPVSEEVIVEPRIGWGSG